MGRITSQNNKGGAGAAIGGGEGCKLLVGAKKSGRINFVIGFVFMASERGASPGEMGLVDLNPLQNLSQNLLPKCVLRKT